MNIVGSNIQKGAYLAMSHYYINTNYLVFKMWFPFVYFDTWKSEAGRLKCISIFDYEVFLRVTIIHNGAL